MRPVNFIKNKKKKNIYKIKLTFFVPIILVFTFILIDYININAVIKKGNENHIEIEEVLNLESEINELKQSSDDLMSKRDFLEYLDDSNIYTENMINILNYTREFENENTFITSIYFDNFIKISGHSIDEKSIVKLLESLNEIYNAFSLEEINYSNGYYSFNIGEVGK